MPAIPVSPCPGDNGEYEARDQDVALAAIVTQEGQSPDSRCCWQKGHDEEAMRSLLDVAAAVHFEPASFAGTPVAVNMIWLLAHTTVRGS